MKVTLSPLDELIKQGLSNKGLKEKDLLKTLKVSRTTLYHWRSGRFFPTEKHAGKICRALEISEKDYKKAIEDLSAIKTRGDFPRANAWRMVLAGYFNAIVEIYSDADRDTREHIESDLSRIVHDFTPD